MKTHSLRIAKENLPKNLSFENDFINIHTKSDLYLKENQEILKKLHGKDRAIACMCNHYYDKENKLYLYVKKIPKKSLLTLARYPGGANHEHRSSCIFNTEVSSLINDEGSYKAIIFDEPAQRKGSESSKEALLSKEIARAYTYNMLCEEIVSSTCTSAFKEANRKPYKGLSKEEKETFYKNNFTFDEFCKSLKIELARCEKVDNRSLYEILKKRGSFLNCGIIKKEELSLHFENFEAIEINNDNEKDLVSFQAEQINLFLKKEIPIENHKIRTTNRRLKISLKQLRNYKNLVNTDYYFYMGISCKGITKKLKLMPIYYENNRICFVESGYESKYAKKLFDDGIPFIKPISNQELKCLVYSRTIPNINYRADFILFENGKIKIVEVSGYNDKKYLSLLRNKEVYYKKLGEKYNFFEFLLIDGKSL